MAKALANRDLDAAERAGLNPAERRLLEFVELCVRRPWKLSDQVIQDLREQGFSDEQIAEAALNVAMFLALTTMADVYGLGDSGFHLREIDPRVGPSKDEIIEQDLNQWRCAAEGK